MPGQIGEFKSSDALCHPQQLAMAPLLPSFISLPNDVIFSILMRFPVKSLLRFRCVCKNWDSIIRSKTFILNYSFSRPQGYIFIRFFYISIMSSPNIQSCIVFWESSFSEVKLEIPYTSDDPSQGHLIVIGSCKGLLCMTNFKYFGCELYIWNPSIRRRKILPTSLFPEKSSRRFEHPKTSTIVGLGFDSKTNDYKVLRITNFCSKSHQIKSKPPPQAEIYSLSMDSWRSVAIPDHLMKRFIETYSWHYAYLNGAFYWLAEFIDDEGMHYSSVLRFDVSKERFTEVKLPNDYLNGIDSRVQRLVVFKGLLAIIINGNDTSEGGGRICYIWMMNGSFWTKQKLKFAGVRWHCMCVGDHLVLEQGYKQVYLVDPQTLEKKAVGIPRPVSVYAFTESLALL